MSTPLQKYRHIKQGRAELHAHPLTTDEEQEQIHVVGTSGCRTCMCVYVRFKDNLVFIAHMVAHAAGVSKSDGSHSEHQSEDGASDDSDDQWISDPIRGEKLKQKVLAKLQASLLPNAGATELENDLIAKIWATGPEEAFAVCPAIFYDGESANGWFMKEAVREFFKLNATRESEESSKARDLTVHKGHGFVAGPGIDTVIFRYSGEGMSHCDELGPKHYQWKACTGEVNNTKAFNLGFVYDNDMWEEWDVWSTPSPKAGHVHPPALLSYEG